MSMVPRYSGEFLSRSGVKWKVVILQESEEVFQVTDLTFPAESPLVIEWENKSKEEPLCGSTATLKIESPGDRTFIDLYSIAPGQICLDVYREGVLYWSGCLDPEFYEEPYDRGAFYDVELTFSDFGILGRLPYDLTGPQTLRAILNRAIYLTKGNFSGVDETRISTKFEDGKPVTLDSLSIASENFFDEDGEASTYQEVIEGILQPLALRMIQKAGKIYIYDLNALYEEKNSDEIEWDGTGSVMGTDRVYNNAKITFSPYSSSTLLSGEMDYLGKYSVNCVNIQNEWPGTPGSENFDQCYSYYTDYDESHRVGYNWDYSLVDFTIFLGGKATGLASIGPWSSYFHILPMLGGNESTGVVGGFYSGGHGDLTTGWPKRKGVSPENHQTFEILTTNRAYLPTLSASDAKTFRVRVVTEILADPRYNPFEQSGGGNEGGNYDNIKARTGWAFIPVAITIYDASGKALYHYDNKEIAEGGVHGYIGSGEGTWKAGAGTFGDAWLSYYDPDDLKENTGILGWKKNRHCIGTPYGKLSDGKEFYMFDSFKKMADGQYIPYPPTGGYIEVKVFNGLYCYDFSETIYLGSLYKDQNLPIIDGSKWDKWGYYKKLRWLLYHAPVVDVVRKNLVFDEAETDDIEYKGVVNRNAKDDIEIDTICGTSDIICPTAKGIFFRTSTGEQIQKLKRADRVDHPEQLLIGTLYSQFGTRMTTLTGVTVLTHKGLRTYTDEAQDPGTRFMIVAEEQDLIADESETTFIELRPDEYTSK